MSGTYRYAIELTVPPATPPEEPVFLAADVNGWDPDDVAFRFARRGAEAFLSFAAERPVVACKVTRGSWLRAECLANGEPMANRRLRAGPAVHRLGVAAWTDQTPSSPLPPGVHLLHPAMAMPQLGRRRRIWALLPPACRAASERRFRVLYMQDGQNLFDNPHAIYGSWDVDRALRRLFLQPDSDGSPEACETLASTIIIGIENGREQRLDEYSPWPNGQHGGGEGDAYLSFVVDTLKPFVDSRLPTLTGPAHTGVMGSSMGGLFSLYAALRRPDVFGLAAAFSPSLWFSDGIFDLARRRPSLPVRLLLVAGHRESKAMVGNLLALYETLLEAGHDRDQLHYDLHSDGAHAEWFWAREFEHALRWLLDRGEHDHGDHVFHDRSVTLVQDRARRELTITLQQPLRSPVLEIHDFCHDRVVRRRLEGPSLTLSYADWDRCVHALRLTSADDLVFSRRLDLGQ